MAKKQNKKTAATQIRQVDAKTIRNDGLKDAIHTVRETKTRENEVRMFEEIQKASFLVPVEFAGQQPALQLRFVMVNTPEGKSYFPVFTDLSESENMKFPEGDNHAFIVRTLKEFEPIFKDTRGQSSGIVINPFSGNIVLPRETISKLNSSKATNAVAAPAAVKNGTLPAGVSVRFEEPRIYPTAMINAVYDRCASMPEVSRVWFKQMMLGADVNFALIVEADKYDASVENPIREAAEPLAKNVPVQILKYTDELEKKAVDGAIALYDRELNL